MIVSDVVAAIEDRRFPLLLTERKDHLEVLFEKLVRRVPNIFVMKGGMGKKQRDALASEVSAVADGQTQPAKTLPKGSPEIEIGCKISGCLSVALK